MVVKGKEYASLSDNRRKQIRKERVLISSSLLDIPEESLPILIKQLEQAKTDYLHIDVMRRDFVGKDVDGLSLARGVKSHVWIISPFLA